MISCTLMYHWSGQKLHRPISVLRERFCVQFSQSVIQSSKPTEKKIMFLNNSYLHDLYGNSLKSRCCMKTTRPHWSSVWMASRYSYVQA